MDSLNRAKDLFLLALRYQNAGELQRAESLYREALKLAPGRPSVINNLAAVLLQGKRYEEARELCGSLLARDPDNAAAWLNLGNCRSVLESPQAALESYDKALSLDAGYVEALNSRAKVLIDLERADEALRNCDQALAIQPQHPEVLNNRGGALLDLGRYDEALESYEKAIAVKPDWAEAHYNRANTLGHLRRYEDALAGYNRTLEIDPEYINAHWNEALCRLLLGDFPQGWQKYEWRWKNDQGRKTQRHFPVPLWDGRQLDGVLLAWGEQGLGEQILYARMLTEVRPRAGKLIVEVHGKLVDLFARSFPGIEVAVLGSTDAAHIAAHVPLGSLGQYFRNEWEDFPQSSSYLVPNSNLAATLRRRIAEQGKLVVGLSWFSTTKRRGENKSIRLADLAPILMLRGVKFVDLQYGMTGAQRQAVMDHLGVEVHRIADVDNENDVDALAALISACDAVVSISNTTAHLAGALGKATYLLLPYALPSHWHWHIGRERSPWYPAVRVFRQPAVGDWQGAMREIMQELAANIADNPRPA